MIFLRCSTNLDGPTVNFSNIDKYIIDKINGINKYFFQKTVILNHVLAQVYKNITIQNDDNQKNVKAKIIQHSDKTEDMPKEGLIVFVSLYKNYLNHKFNNDIKYKQSENNPYDFYYKNVSILTKLRFHLKKDVIDENLEKQFDITLYPNSAFIISLSTNRLYTHEVIPSVSPIDKIPTRMGFTIRCSDRKAIYDGEQTYICKYGKEFKLEEPTKENVEMVKQLYLKENTTSEIINYGDNFNFSFNQGDYKKPLL